jgi:uncharacterized protein (UPF0335 family)|tara:strand:- start:1486 stop:1722 length:237 start_codon:yes stop_codon:yes gene_type:complete
MSTQEDVIKFVEEFLRIENERKLLQDDQKELFESYKSKLDVKALKAAIRIAKIKSRLGDSENEMDNMLEAVESKICLD